MFSSTAKLNIIATGGYLLNNEISIGGIEFVFVGGSSQAQVDSIYDQGHI